MALQKVTDIDTDSISTHAIVLALYEGTQFYGGVYAEKGYNLSDFSSSVGKVFVLNGSERIPIAVNGQNTYGTCEVSNFDSTSFAYCWVRQKANAELTNLPLYFWGLGATYTGKQVINVGETLSLEVTADSGKVFETAPYLTVRNADKEETDINFTISEGGKKATLSYQVGDIVCALITAFTVDAPEPPQTATVSETLTNCTSQSVIPDTIEIGQTLNITLIPNSGYEFTDTPYLNITGNDTKQINFTVDGNASVSYTVESGVTNIEVIGTASEKQPTPNVVNNIEYTELSTDYDGDTIEITVKTEYYYSKRIDQPKATYTQISGGLKTVDMQESHNEYQATATVSISDFDISQPITLTGTVIDTLPLTVDLSNCISETPLNDYVDYDSRINVTLTANPNTEFSDASKVYLQLVHRVGGEQTTIPFNISADKLSASLDYTLTDSTEYNRVIIHAEAFPKQVVGQNYGAINVYIVTLDNLQDFAEKRFNETYDLGSYVNRIQRIFADVPVYSADVLRCGDYNTGISVEQPANENITLDFGNVTIPAHNENTTDFDGEIQVFLPFKGFVTLPVDYVGKNINLQYVIDIITGNGVAKLSYNGVVFQIEETQPCQPVIYRTSENELKTVGDDNWNTYILYGLEPYIYCKWYEGMDEGRNNDRQTGILGDFRGFNVFDDVTPIHTAEMLSDEQEMIYTALSDGVYIE